MSRDKAETRNTEMSSRQNLLRRASALGILALAVLAAAEPEKDVTDKTSHRYVSNVSEQTIDNLVAEGYRLFDIEVVSTRPHKYAGSFVKNSGPYKANWWWTANKTKTDLVNWYTERGARIVDIEAYTVDGVRRYAATAVENRGREQKDWWWFDNSKWEDMLQFVADNNARIIDLDVEVTKSGRRFSGVMLKNSGVDYKAWKVFSNITKDEVKDLMTENRMRLVDIERISDDKFAGILEERGGQNWWWFTNQDWEETQRLIGQFGSRVIDIERRVDSKQSRFDIILLDNNNDLEWRIGDMLRSGSDGTRGFILKQVNGPTLGELMPTFRTYPASTIKVLEHYYWSRQVGLGLAANTQVPIYTNHTEDTHVQSDVSTNQTLQLTMQQMMRPSNNQSANALQEFAGNGNGATGRTVLNTFASNVLGLDTDDIRLYHKFADGNVANDPYNIMTMRQIASLYENFANSTGLNAAGWNFFRNNMLNDTGVGGNAFIAGVQTVMQQEGNALGMTNAEVNAVFNQVILCWKPGNVTGYNSSAGWIRVPYKTVNGTVFKEFVVAVFQDDITFNTLGSMSGNMLPEILRDELSNALFTWK